MDCAPNELVRPQVLRMHSRGQPGSMGECSGEYPPGGNQTKTESRTRSAPQSAESMTPPSVSKVPLPKCREIMTRGCSDAKLRTWYLITTPLTPCRTLTSIRDVRILQRARRENHCKGKPRTRTVPYRYELGDARAGDAIAMRSSVSSESNEVEQETSSLYPPISPVDTGPSDTGSKARNFEAWGQVNGQENERKNFREWDPEGNTSCSVRGSVEREVWETPQN